MKTFLLLGGFCGFLLAFGSSWHAGNLLAYALRDAGIGCLVGATLFRGLHHVYWQAVRARFTTRAEEIIAQRTRKRPQPPQP